MHRTSSWRIAALSIVALIASPAAAAPLTVPFDFSRHEIALQVTVKGSSLLMLLDTGVDPSVIDLARAQHLALPIDRRNGGQGSGEGAGSATVYPTTIRQLAVAGRAYADADALAADLTAMSKGYGRTLDGVLGYSFLKDKTIVVDYKATTVTIGSNAREVEALTRNCKRHFVTPLRWLDDDKFPLVDSFKIGTANAPVTLDTGSNRNLTLYQAALGLNGIRKALAITGKNQGAGFRGDFSSDSARLGLPVNLGPFAIAPGTVVTVMAEKGSPSRVGNVGNAAISAMGIRLLLDYTGHRIGFYGDCE